MRGLPWLTVLLLPAIVRAVPFEMTLKGSMVASQITSAFKDTHIDLASDHKKGGVLVKGGQVQFGPALGSKHIEFSVPADKIPLGYFGDITYRLHDVHLKSMEATATDHEIVLLAHFDGQGPQLVGTHSMLGHVVPGVFMQDIRVTTRITPCVDNQGRLSYKNVHTTFVARMNTQGLSFDVHGQHIDVLDSITGYRDRLSKLIAQKIQETLDNPERKNAIAGFLNQALQDKAGQMGAVVKAIRVEGSDLKVMVEMKPKPPVTNH
jgi:hypothetical protein